MEVSGTSGVGSARRSTVQPSPISKRASNNCRVLGNALKRVNVANRYLGNKACKYETKVVSTPKRASTCQKSAAQRGDPSNKGAV